MSNNFDFSQYDGELENECIYLTRSIINARRRIQKNIDCNNFRLASRTSLLDAVTHLNLLLGSIFYNYENFENLSE